VDIPATKPAYSQMVPDHDGRVWIRSIAGTRHEEGCDPQERGSFCWPDVTAVDLFAADGRYLGSVDIPPPSDSTSGRSFPARSWSTPRSTPPARSS
jgi:hypothetical protein